MIEQMRNDMAYRLNVTTKLSLIINILYSFGNVALGVMNRSYWFITMGAYFLTLSVMRISCVNALRINSEKTKYIGRLIGILFLFLSIVLGGTIILSHRMDVETPLHQIVVLSIATYTTIKTTIAVINIVKVAKTGNPIWIALRNISCADAAAAILSMQRTMLVSFGDMEVDTIRLMNILTGIGVCFLVLFLGIKLILRPNDMKLGK